MDKCCYPCFTCFHRMMSCKRREEWYLMALNEWFNMDYDQIGEHFNAQNIPHSPLLRKKIEIQKSLEKNNEKV